MATRLREVPITWSKDGQFCFIDGQAWGVNKKLKTVWVGTEKDIKKGKRNERTK